MCEDCPEPRLHAEAAPSIIPLGLPETVQSHNDYELQTATAGLWQRIKMRAINSVPMLSRYAEATASCCGACRNCAPPAIGAALLGGVMTFRSSTEAEPTPPTEQQT
jgi:hypothetical protein